MDPCMHDKIKLAVWGVGRHARKRILAAIENTKSVELSGIYTRNQTHGKEEAKKRGCRYFLSSDEMLSDPNIQAVFLCTPTGLHFSQGKSVLQAGKHLWCEKPIATSFKHSQELIELAINKNLFVGEAYMYKYHEQFRRLKETVENKHLGKLMRMICRFSIPVLDQPGFRINPDLGASALLDLGSYTFSLANELFKGQPTFELAEYYKDDKAIDQNGFCVLGYQGGTKAILEWSYNSCYINQAELWFEKGTITTDKIFSKSDDYCPVLRVRMLSGDFKDEKLLSENSYVNMLDHFSHCTTERSTNDYEVILSTSKLISAFAKQVRMPEISWQ
jgi:NDP-hexose-3-ketoreductase